MHIITTIMPQWGSDTDDDAYYGGVLAAVFADNAGSSVASSVTQLVEENMPSTDGNACPPGGGYTLGGGHGINGCGCYMSFSTDAINASAYFKEQTETWSELQNDFYDASGEGYWYYNLWCNYNTSTYPLSL